MFSHVLAAYQTALLDFATKTSYTFQAALKILEEKPQYNFTILKDLTQVPVVRDTNPSETKEIAPIDFDQMLFFKVFISYLRFPSARKESVQKWMCSFKSLNCRKISKTM